MRKGFTRKPQADEPATRGKNYITRSGLQRLKDEHQFLLTRDRPAVTEVVAWAASNGDRSENADYQYGKRRLRQIDGRLRFLTKRIKAAEVVDPEAPRARQPETRAFFGATVRYANAAGAERVVSIVGTDEVDLNRNHIGPVPIQSSQPSVRETPGAGIRKNFGRCGCVHAITSSTHGDT
jgi:transcription elongation factor GreB